MKKALARINFIKNIFGVLSILVSFAFIGFNIYLNKGNNLINYCLLALTFIYFIIYLYSSFVSEDKKLKKLNARNFKRGKKLIGFLDNVLIVVAVFTSQSKSFFTILFALISIGGYLFYVVMDVISMIIRHKINKLIEKYKKNKEEKQINQVIE